MATVGGRCGASALRSVWNRRMNSGCRRLFSSPPRCSSLQPPDVPLLAEVARISLSPKEVEDFAPKIRQVVDWFGQLQAVDLESIQPSFRAVNRSIISKLISVIMRVTHELTINTEHDRDRVQD